MAKGYVSDFANFMSRYMQENPAVVEDQRICAGILAPGETRLDGSANNPPRLTIPVEPVAPREPRQFLKRLRSWRKK